jgi:hypothetical protein
MTRKADLSNRSEHQGRNRRKLQKYIVRYKVQQLGPTAGLLLSVLRANVVAIGNDALHSSQIYIHLTWQSLRPFLVTARQCPQNTNLHIKTQNTKRSKWSQTHLDAKGGRASFHMSLCDRNERKAGLICKPHRSPLPPFTKAIPPTRLQFHGLNHVSNCLCYQLVTDRSSTPDCSQKHLPI